MKWLSKDFQLLKEDLQKLTYGLQMSRTKLPQLDQKDIPAFLDYLVQNKIEYNKAKIGVSELIPSQSKLNLDKVETLMDKGEKDLTSTPIFITKDDEILDGHHRWAALKMLNKQSMMPVYQIELDFKEAIKIMNKFSKSYNKNMYDK